MYVYMYRVSIEVPAETYLWSCRSMDYYNTLIPQ